MFLSTQQCIHLVLQRKLVLCSSIYSRLPAWHLYLMTHQTPERGSGSPEKLNNVPLIWESLKGCHKSYSTSRFAYDKFATVFLEVNFRHMLSFSQIPHKLGKWGTVYNRHLPKAKAENYFFFHMQTVGWHQFISDWWARHALLLSSSKGVQLPKHLPRKQTTLFITILS